jgi:hypothetical protein
MNNNNPFDMLAYSLALNKNLFNLSKSMPRKKKKAARKLYKQNEALWIKQAIELCKLTFNQ